MFKKVLFIPLFLLLSFSYLYANDSIYGIIGENLVPIEGEDNDIEMTAETITMTLYDDYYEVDVDFTFTNYGKLKKINVGFPVTYANSQAKLYDFKAWTDGKAVEREFKPIIQDKNGGLKYIPPKGHSKGYWIYPSEFAYTIPIFFRQGITKTRVNYKNIYRFDEKRTFDNLYYYYGSGKAWKNSIGSIEFIVKNYSPYCIRGIQDYLGNENIEWIDDSTFKLTYKDVEPDVYYHFEVIISNLIETELRERFSSRHNYQYYTKKQLRILRNHIYAIHGYQFKSKDLADIFGNLSWYQKNPNYSDSLLSDEEKKEIEIIQKEEEARP
ncbi:MAG: YARHG domain-containing protein [Treponema sp.]|nr:YARHG domain-containing protein [Treponema sp.]